MKQTKTRGKHSPKREKNVLVIFSLVMMCLSLALPAYIESKDSIVWGGLMLCFVPFAWLAPPGGLALYANFFYLNILRLLKKQRNCHISTLSMLVFASFSVMFNGQSFFLGKMASGPLTGWGWGAFIWGISITSLAAACFTSKLEKNYKRDITIIMVLSSIFLIPTAVKHIKQYSQANDKERQDYFYHRLIAFTYQELSGKAYTPLPDSITVDHDTTLAISGTLDDKLHLIENGFSVKTPRSFQYDGKFWQTYWVNDGYIALLKPPKTVDYVFGIRPKKSSTAELFILGANEDTLWQAEIFQDEHNHIYPNYHHDFLNNLFRPTTASKNYQQARPSNDYNVEDSDEIATEACELLTLEPLQTTGTRIRFNNQLMQLSFKYGDVLDFSFCSAHYAFLPLLKKEENNPPTLFFIVFEKSTMLPLWLFQTGYVSKEEIPNTFWQAYQKGQPLSDMIKSVETVIVGKASNHKELHLATSHGTVILKRDFDWTF